MIVDAEVMLKPHHRGRATVPHGVGGIGGDDPALASSVPQDPTAVGRGWEKRPEPEREQSHGTGCAEASAVAAAIGGEEQG